MMVLIRFWRRRTKKTALRVLEMKYNIFFYFYSRFRTFFSRIRIFPDKIRIRTQKKSMIRIWEKNPDPKHWLQ